MLENSFKIVKIHKLTYGFEKKVRLKVIFFPFNSIKIKIMKCLKVNIFQ